MKLTIAQQRLLERIEYGACSCVDDYKPMRGLVDKGLADYSPGKFGHGRATITVAGLKYLAEKKASQQ
ncbi:MAG: hypothetical protein E6R03_03705 [Hyphomicrobiaceae bacterium]|nr:MAG: hypothetical protein E6R03_03705 [Hyphomicrobiaceae bacterium]